jgi:hypothetical protein
MGRLTHVCATCSEHFTRKYSATRHNLTIHDNRGEIVPLLEYLAGRNSGRYRPSRPSLYRRPSKKRIHRFGHAISADSMGDFRPRGLQQQQTPFQSIQTPRALSLPSTSQAQPQPQGVLSYPPDRISEPIEKTNHQGPISQETLLKIQEVKRLVNQYPQDSGADAFVRRCATFYSINGDNTILDEMLQNLRMISNFRK